MLITPSQIGANTTYFPNGKYIEVYDYRAAGVTANRSLYTVPAGRQAIWTLSRLFNSHATLSTSEQMFLKRNGRTTLLYNTVSVTAQAGVNLGTGVQQMILNAGDEMQWVTATQGDMTIWGYAIEYDAMDGYPTCKVLNSGTIGDNTLYTCPAGKKATVVASNGWRSIGSNELPGVFCLNRSGATLTAVNYNLVPSGGSPSTANRFNTAGTVTNGSLNAQFMPAVMSAGDYININLSATSADILMWVNVIETPV